MNCQKSRSARWDKKGAVSVKRAAIYISLSAYGEDVDMDEALKKCRAYVKKKKDLKLMRIYRDEKVTVTGSTAGQAGTRSRSPLGAEGNDAWKRMLVDIETSAVEAVVIYAARTVAPTISTLDIMVREYFIPCNIRFIDVEADFDTMDGDADAYLKARNSEYRSNLKRRPYKKREKKEAAVHGQTKPGCEIHTAVLEENNDSGVADSPLCTSVR